HSFDHLACGLRVIFDCHWHGEVVSAVCNVDFLFMIRVPRISALFPYTTLFRSCLEWLIEVSLELMERLSLSCMILPTRSDSCLADRKSTRLNSSHVKISYAVFCLKKKRKESRWQSMTRSALCSL